MRDRRSILEMDVVERAAGGPVLRDRRSALEMACNIRGKRRISRTWVFVLRGVRSVW